MPSQVIKQPAHRTHIPIRIPPPCQRLISKTAEERNGRPPHRFVFLHNTFYAALISAAVGGIILLLKTGQCLMLSAGKTHGAVGVNALVIYHVHQHFFYRPFAGGIAVQQLRFRKRAHQLLNVFKIIAQMLQDVAVIWHQVNIHCRVGGVFIEGGFGDGFHKGKGREKMGRKTWLAGRSFENYQKKPLYLNIKP